MLPEPHRIAAQTHLNTAKDVGLIWRINQAIWSDPRTKGHRIEVNAVEGRIRLMGEVPNRDIRKAAVEIVTALAGVSAVHDDIVLAHGGRGH